MSKLTFSEALAALKEINHLSAIDEALTFFENHYKNIPIDAALEDIDMSRRKYYLDLHQSLGHVITYNDKDGRYRTYVYHKDGSSQLIARGTKKAVEDKVIEHYETVELLITVDKIKDDYFQERQKFVKQSTIAREKGIYNSFFKGNLITTMAFSRIKTKDVEEFMDTTLREKKLSKKAFNNLKSLVNGIFDYAVANEYAERNVAREIRSFGRSYFNDKGRYDDREMYYEHQTGFSDDMLGDEDDDTSFSDDIVDETDDDITQYFPPADQNKLIETAMQIFRNSLNTAYLAIILTFCLGLRIGELVGLKVSDFDFEANIVHIRRQEVYKFKDSKKCGVRISRKMKTANSNRKIPISPFCKKVFEIVVEENNRRGIDSEYLFISTTTGERMHAASIDKALNIANREAGLPQRSIHKIRKTVLSRLNMSLNFTLERIREIAGHSRESVVLYTNYFYHIDDLDGITECRTFEEVVDFGMPNFFDLDTPAASVAEEPKPSESEAETCVIPFKRAI